MQVCMHARLDTQPAGRVGWMMGMAAPWLHLLFVVELDEDLEACW